MPVDSAADDKPKQFLGLSGTQTIGSALAAVTSALVGSFLGVAGTLIGAALGSVVATVGAALYARTLSSAATVAMKKIPQRGRGGLPADDGQVLAASAPAESEPRAKRVRRQFTRKTWIRVGAVSAAAFVIAMVGVTAVEFGTNQPISSLVSSTSGIDGGAAEHTTTLGKALSGSPTASVKTDEAAKNLEQPPGQTPEGAHTEGGLTTDNSPSSGDSGPAGTEAPGADQSTATTPADIAPETEQSPEPVPETAQTSEPETSSDPGSTEQPAP
ncbi:hypothetical protein [Arthrobacter sp. ov118]|uniref:hypothetical protein n=1 Tax=Arthrobacter sp. ov118 TaxID=1761747 RepID=UPI0011607152|nr:hypothetical protein [Arthrobacter sp. ov118]